MEIKGTIIITPLMSEMEVGQKGYLTTDAIVVINGNMVFIGTGYSISELKQDKYAIPIGRTGSGDEDYEIDFHIARSFFNTKVNKEDIQKIIDSKNFIGPYEVATEIEQLSNYREQCYPRMDLAELLNSLGEINELLGEDAESEIYKKDRAKLRKLIKGKLSNLPLEVLQNYEKTFSPLDDEESDGGREVNYFADEVILRFVKEKIEILMLEEMEVPELIIEETNAARDLDFEKAGYIRKIIDRKNGK
jgi:hypothetical protein